VNPTTGIKSVVYTAPDYFGGAPSESSPLCFQPGIGAGTLGLALHPDFLNSTTSYIYYVYSYNQGTAAAPATQFKIVRLTWNATQEVVVSSSTIVSSLPTGYDHLGGRLLAVRQQGNVYLYFTTGDNGISETNSPDCYNPQTINPNNFAQDPTTKNGKVHRFNIDGSVPADNPLPGNSFFTRGHRNPQGLAFNPTNGVVYEIEHGDRTDDEINILTKGLNYGWKNVRGYHDGNYPGELAYIQNYIPNPSIRFDRLEPAWYAWATTPPPSTANQNDWESIAPSDGIYYGSAGIPAWTNSLLVVTLKNGTTTDQELYQFKLTPNGLGIVNGAPQRFFGTDQALNGRLRDVAVSPDGTKIYVVNNGGADRDKITVYTYVPSSVALNLTTQITNASCGQGGAINLTVSGGTPPYRYAWTGPNNFAASTEDINSLSAGTYSVTVTDAVQNSATQQATILSSGLDTTPPIVLAAGFVVELNSSGTRTIEAGDVDYGSTDECSGLAAMTLDKTTFTCANVGPNNVTLTVTDNAGNSASQTVTIVVVDNTAPTVRAAGLAVALINGTRTIEAADVDYGSYDDCGSIASLSISPRTFTCANVGPNQVTLTVADNAGNVATQTVTVLITADASCNNTASSLQASTRISAMNSGQLLEAYPNPVTEQATIVFRPIRNGNGQVKLYNQLGTLVATLYEAVVEGGHTYSVSLDSRLLPSGVYNCQFISSGKISNKRILVTK
jgi:glucose/arabinose dehydrogenase